MDKQFTFLNKTREVSSGSDESQESIDQIRFKRPTQKKKGSSIKNFVKDLRLVIPAVDFNEA